MNKYLVRTHYEQCSASFLMLSFNWKLGKEMKTPSAKKIAFANAFVDLLFEGNFKLSFHSEAGDFFYLSARLLLTVNIYFRIFLWVGERGVEEKIYVKYDYVILTPFFEINQNISIFNQRARKGCLWFER